MDFYFNVFASVLVGLCRSGGPRDEQQLLLMQAHAVPFELNWRVWVGRGSVVLSKLCCFKIAKRGART